MISRRDFFTTATAAVTAAAGASWSPHMMAASTVPQTVHRPLGQADHCILLWLAGGVSQIDTVDPKRRGDPATKKPGSVYSSIDTAVPGVQVCEHLPQLARLMEEMTIIRTVNHDVIDEHAAAVNRVFTGRPTSGTVVYPSIGSAILQQRGPVTEGVPGYVLVGYPSVTRGPGFLGAQHGYLYLTDTEKGPSGLSLPPGLSASRDGTRRHLQQAVREAALSGKSPRDPMRQFDGVIDASHALISGPFRQVFDLTSEPGRLRQQYGGEFGQRCLLARRLVQNGVRFVEVQHNLAFSNGTGWDTHEGGLKKQHILIQEWDQAMASLMNDLRQVGLLERTLIMVATEFGRPADFDSGGGRGHQPGAFSLVLAGGGLRHQGAWGVTDELAAKPIERAVSIPDFHATVYEAMGIPSDVTLRDGDRPVPLTDGGRALSSLIA